MTVLQLTDEQIMWIRSDYAAGLSQHKIAVKYGIGERVVRRHVEDIPSPRQRQDVVRKCPACPILFYDRKRDRVYCSGACRLRHQKQEAAHRMDEFKWIAGTDTWANIAERVGLSSVKSLREWLRTYGEIAWAERVVDETSERPRQGRWAA